MYIIEIIGFDLERSVEIVDKGQNADHHRFFLYTYSVISHFPTFFFKSILPCMVVHNLSVW